MESEEVRTANQKAARKIRWFFLVCAVAIMLLGIIGATANIASLASITKDRLLLVAIISVVVVWYALMGLALYKVFRRLARIL